MPLLFLVIGSYSYSVSFSEDDKKTRTVQAGQSHLDVFVVVTEKQLAIPVNWPPGLSELTNINIEYTKLEKHQKIAKWPLRKVPYSNGSGTGCRNN